MIKEIQPCDLNVWVELQHELWPTHSIADLIEDCNKILTDKLQKSWLFIDNNSPIGFIDLSIKKKAIGCKSGKIGYVEGWYVKPDYQRKGFGQQLYEVAENWAKNQGCKEMASDTTQDYPYSPRAHEIAGFKVARVATHFNKDIS